MTREDRVKKIIHEAARQLHDIMNVTPAQAAKDVVKRAIGRSTRTKDPLFWPAGMLMLGLVQAAKWCEEKAVEGKAEAASGNEKFIQVRDAILHALNAHTQLWLQKYDGRLDYVDDALAGVAFVRLYEMTGYDQYKKAADRIAEYLDKAPVDAEGAILYNGGRSRNIFVDGIGQVSMFYAVYSGMSPENAGYLDKAAKQLLSFRKYGMDQKSGLNYHGYELLEEKAKSGEGDGCRCEKKGLLGWGRAFGWLMMGLSETAALMYDRVGDRGEIIGWYKELAELAAEYQRSDGGFSWQLQAVEGHIDMSATGMITYGLERGLQAGILGDTAVEGNDAEGDAATGRGSEDSVPIREVVLRAQKSMYANSTNGIVTEALSSCDDFGVHYQTYGTYPWGQGAVLLTLTAEA